MGYRELLRTQRDFRRIWLGQIVSELGDWLQFIALVGLFPPQGKSALLLSGLFIVRLLPSILLAPVAGVVADRFPRVRVMVACDLGRAAIVASYLFVRGPEDVIWIYGLVFAQESLSALFEPARSAAIPQVVEPGALFAANTLSGATWSAMLAFGSALGGLIAGTLGPRAAFLVDASSFVVSAILLGGVRLPPVAEDPACGAASPRDTFGIAALREGLGYLSAHRPQAVAALVKGLWGLSGGVVFLFSIYAGRVFTPGGGDPARVTGLLYAGRGLGAFVGPLLAQRFLGESSASLRRGIVLGFPIAALAFAAFAFAPSAALGACILVVAHAGGSTCWVNSTQLLQLSVPNRLLGRVCAVELAALTFALGLSNAFAGAALGDELLDLRGVTLAMAGAALVSSLVWAAAMSRLGRGLDAAADLTRPSAEGPATLAPP